MTETTEALWDRYIGEVRRTSTQVTGTPEAVIVGALGLSGETAEVAEEAEATGDATLQRLAAGANRKAGLVADIVKKAVFHEHPDMRAKFIKELGDVFWYLALMMDTLGISLLEVLEANIAKLRKRYPDKFSTERSINREDS